MVLSCNVVFRRQEPDRQILGRSTAKPNEEWWSGILPVTMGNFLTAR